MKVEINLESSQHFVPDQSYTMDSTEEPVLDRAKDDMASRRTTNYIPAPLRKKKNEEMYKRFITPQTTSNPMNYLQQHMRSKSLSDLVKEQKEEEHHRAEINERYGEMEKVKELLKEDEEVWTSHLQSWKSRRRSVTEDARKRKEARDSIEKEVEVKSTRRKSKTYREIVHEKMRRDKELAQLEDHDEYEFVSPRSSTSGTTASQSVQSTVWSSYESPQNKSMLVERKESDKRIRTYSDHLSESSRNSPRLTDVMLVSSPPPPNTKIAIQPIKYTTKVTAVINHVPTNSDSSDTVFSSDLNHEIDLDLGRNKSTLTHEFRKQDSAPVVKRKAAIMTSGSYTLPRDFTPAAHLDKTVPWSEGSSKHDKTSEASDNNNQVSLQNKKSTIPTVVLRAKYPNATSKPRPKSAHDIGSNGKPSWSSTLPRNYRDYSSPKPFVAGSNTTGFSKIRRAAFANKRNLFESLSKTEPDDDGYAETNAANKSPPQKTTIPEAPFSSKQSNTDSVKPSFLRNQQAKAPLLKSDQSKPAKVPLVTPTTSLSVSRYGNSTLPKSNNRYPAKVPLISAASIPLSIARPNARPSVEKPQAPTATLTSSGLSLSSPRTSKLEPRSEGNNTLFDDMKICINQRPRSEKGFGFTVRGGNDGKPVIVDTVSAGGAADICQLCVSDEILAINDVPLADCKTQDDIVHLIVSSVITGNLSLNIRRYGRSKKASPLRLSGTKVVMTPGGFVQIRSDKPGLKSTSHTMNFTKEFSLPAPPQTKDANNNEACEEDLPPPPSPQELELHDETVKSPVHTTHVRPTSPLTNLISVASNDPTYIYNQNSSESEETSNGSSIDALSEVHTNRVHDNEEDLQIEVLQAQKAIEFEEAYVYHDQQRKKEVLTLRMKLEKEQRMLDEEEAQRDVIRKKILEESRLEDIRVEEELRRLNARKQEKIQRRMEQEHFQARETPTSTSKRNSTPPQRHSRTNGLGKEGAVQHWMIEEAERRRLAETEGRPRMAAQQYGRKMQHSGGPLPDHVIQHLAERTAKNRMHSHGSHIQDPYNTWNDPNPQATLL